MRSQHDAQVADCSQISSAKINHHLPNREEQAVEDFLLSAVPVVQAEPATTAWFALKLGTSTFGIFDAFPDEKGRQARLWDKLPRQ